MMTEENHLLNVSVVLQQSCVVIMVDLILLGGFSMECIYEIVGIHYQN